MSVNAIFIGDIVEANGKTVKQNNLEKMQSIPVGSIVEITYQSKYEDPEESTFGLRLFVVNHSRDCDGSPLYTLSFRQDAWKNYQEMDEKIKNREYSCDDEFRIMTLLKFQYQGSLMNGYDEGSLKVIKRAE